MADYKSEYRGMTMDELFTKVSNPDTTPTTGSQALVTSGGVAAGLAQKAAVSDVNAMAEKIPSGASSSNKLVTQADIANFITRSVNDLVNYYLKSDTYTKQEVQALIAAINQFHYEVYESLSDVTSPASNVLYLIGPTGSGSDKYEEYVYSNSTFVKIGDTSIDLSGYVTTQALNAALATKVNISDIVDNLTTDDATKVLSAKQGKALDGKVNQLGQNIETLITPAHTEFTVVSGQTILNQTYKVFPNVKAGETLTIKYVSSLNIEFNGTYIFYKDGTNTVIYGLATNTLREVQVAKDVDFVSFFLNSPSTSGDVSLYCGKKNDISTRVSALESSSQEMKEDIEDEDIKSSRISSRISPNEISFNVVSGTGINNLTYKNYVDVKAGETLLILYSSALSLTFVATYVYYKDGTSTPISGVATNVLKEYVVAKDVDFVSFYLASPASSGAVTFSCWKKNTIDADIQTLDSAIFDVESSFKVTSGETIPQNKYRLYSSTKAGEKMAVYIKDAPVATIDGIYVKYAGESSLQTIGTSVARYTYNTFTAQKDVEYVTFAISSPSANGYVILNLTLLDSALPQIQRLQSRVSGIKKTIPLVSGSGISSLKYWFFPDIKSGETMRLYAETDDIASIDAVYAKYASNSSLKSLGALSANTEKFIIASDDIEYISFYIASPSSNGEVIFNISRADTLNSVLRLNEQIPIIQKKKVSLSLSSTDKLMLYGDSISSDSYPWYADWIKQFTGLTNVYAGGFPGYNVSQLASATCLQRVFDYAPNVIIIMVGANDIGDIVGTFGDLPGQEIVEDVDISQAYSGTYFIQAVSYILQKIRSYYYDIITRSGLTTPIDMQDTTSVETIDDVLLPYIAVCTPMPENLYGPGPGYEKFNSRKNQLNRRNAVVECCNKHKFHCIDFFNLVDIDWSQEPYFNTPTDTRYSNGIYTMDGLHPNKWGAKKMAEIMLGEVDIKVQ